MITTQSPTFGQKSHRPDPASAANAKQSNYIAQGQVGGYLLAIWTGFGAIVQIAHAFNSASGTVTLGTIASISTDLALSILFAVLAHRQGRSQSVKIAAALLGWLVLVLVAYAINGQLYGLPVAIGSITFGYLVRGLLGARAASAARVALAKT